MSPEAPHILIVDDHDDIRDGLMRYLKRHNYRITTAKDAKEAREHLKRAAIDVVILDIMMPGEDGLSLCRFITETMTLPVILLTALGDDTDRIIGLELGADDYIPKPFNPRELLARLKAVIRRVYALPPSLSEVIPNGGQYVFEKWTLDLASQELRDRDGLSADLSSTEFILLKTLCEHANHVLSRDQILDLTQGRDAQLFDRSIDNQISRLRKKIETNPKNPTLIKTIWGGGYRFCAKVQIESGQKDMT